MIQFKKLIIHNFGSYSHAELDLQNRGFCIVSGKNNYTKDNALSNGSGKSFLWSAICFALTGETIGGIRTNLKNINVEEPECFVQLDFMYNKDFFSLIRIASPKNELKILKNDIDLSGKGIRESEKKLQELIPDLTKDLIASTIIIGQGMPNRFSSFSPSGRKELLEKLTKSDFMIEDLKNRITERSQELNKKIREYDDSLLANNTQLNIVLSRLTKAKEILEQQKQTDFEKKLSEQSSKIETVTATLSTLLNEINTLEAQVDKSNVRLVQVLEEKTKVSGEELEAYNTTKNKLLQDKFQINFELDKLQKDISELKQITDICPTCGQKLPNIYKPDEEIISKEKTLKTLRESLALTNSDIDKCEVKHKDYLSQIDLAFKDEVDSLSKTLTESKQNLNSLRKQYNTELAILDELKVLYNKTIYDKQSFENHLNAQQNELELLESEVARLNNIITITGTIREELNSRFAVVKKMDMLARRDFRGYLLTNIINYLDAKAKEFCKIVFGTNELSLQLNGNSLDITYCGKAFDGLSGGEKQRVDLILQLAIRDMLISYLDLSANILVLDEITDFLDKKSCKAVMNLLEKKLQSVESVFIISHHAEELELPIDSEIRIIKNEQGISELF